MADFVDFKTPVGRLAITLVVFKQLSSDWAMTMPSFDLLRAVGGTLVVEEDILASDVAMEAFRTDRFLCFILKTPLICCRSVF